MKYYETLFVAKDAPYDVIRSSFKILAQTYHPDKPTGNLARFQALQEAWAVLSDAKKRQLYDLGEQTFLTEADRVENAARSDVIAIFNKVVESLVDLQVERFDFKENMRQAVLEIERNANAQLGSVKKKQKKLKKMKRRLKGGEFYFSEYLREQRVACIKNLRHHRFLKKVINRMLEQIDTIDYDFIKTNPISATIWASSTGSSF